LIVNDKPRVLAALEPWAEISQRLRRIFKLTHYLPWVSVYGRAVKRHQNGHSKFAEPSYLLSNRRTYSGAGSRCKYSDLQFCERAFAAAASISSA